MNDLHSNVIELANHIGEIIDPENIMLHNRVSCQLHPVEVDQVVQAVSNHQVSVNYRKSTCPQ